MSGQQTGRVGFRRGLFGRLIPQVEVLKPMRGGIPPRPGSGYQPAQVREVWRDAVVADVLLLGRLVGCTAQMPPVRNPAPPAEGGG